MENHANVGRRNPILKDCRRVEVSGRRSPFQRAERDARALNPAHAVVSEAIVIQAARFLLVELRDLLLRRTAVQLLALRAVELERLPGLAVVRALMNRHRVGLDGVGAEQQTHVGQLELLAERQRQRNVVGRVLVAAEVRVGQWPRLGPPARDIIQVVDVGERGGGEALRRIARIACVALAIHIAVLLGAVGAARRGRLDGRAEGDVDEVRHATARPILVEARVD